MHSIEQSLASSTLRCAHTVFLASLSSLACLAGLFRCSAFEVIHDDYTGPNTCHHEMGSMVTGFYSDQTSYLSMKIYDFFFKNHC